MMSLVITNRLHVPPILSYTPMSKNIDFFDILTTLMFTHSAHVREAGHVVSFRNGGAHFSAWLERWSDRLSF